MSLRISFSLHCSPIKHLISNIKLFHFGFDSLLFLFEDPSECALFDVFHFFLTDHFLLSIRVKFIFFILFAFILLFLLKFFFRLLLRIFLMDHLGYILLQHLFLNNQLLLLQLLNILLFDFI